MSEVNMTRLIVDLRERYTRTLVLLPNWLQVLEIKQSKFYVGEKSGGEFLKKKIQFLNFIY
jgi:hypothetical protein